MKKIIFLISIILSNTFLYPSGEPYQPKTLVKAALQSVVPSFAKALIEGDTEEEYAKLLGLPTYFQGYLKKYLYDRYDSLLLRIFSPPLLPIAILRNYSGVTSVAFSPNGKLIATGSYWFAGLWDLHDLSKPIARLSQSAVDSIVFSPDGNYVLTGSHDSTVKLWDIRDLQHVIFIPLEGHTHWVTSVAFSPNGKYIATGSLDDTAKLWDREDLSKPVATLSHGYAVLSVVFSPNGKYLATSSYDKTVRLWDLEDLSKPVATLEHPQYQVVRAAVFSPNGKYLATGSDDRAVRLWDMANIKGPQKVATLLGHRQEITSIAFSPNGKYLATGSSDKTAKLWDIEDIQNPLEIATLFGHDEGVTSVAFSPDGNLLATGSDDRSVHFWDIRLLTLTLKQLLLLAKLSTLKDNDSRENILSLKWYKDILQSFDQEQQQAIINYFRLPS